MFNFRDFILYEYQTEIPFEPPIQSISITPNKSRSSGLGTNLVYLTSSKSYAQAYANGETSSAHVFGRTDINNGVLFYISLKDGDSHYGGDVWISGFKDDIIGNLMDYMKNPDETYLERLTKEVLNACGLDTDEELSKKTLKNIITEFKKDDLSWMSPIDWSRIQDEYQGYSEIGVKSVSFDEIIKIEVYKNGELVKELKGGKDLDIDDEYGEDEFGDPVFYHGSPLKFWEKIFLTQK